MVPVPLYVAALLLMPPALDPLQPGCGSGWVNYGHGTDFQPNAAEFSGSTRLNIAVLAVALRGGETPILVQSGGGSSQDQALSERRSRGVLDALVSEGIDADRIRIAAAHARQVAPDGLLVYSRIEPRCIEARDGDGG